ncbi:PREDICTED: uncharacterized protein LOC109350539 [Lupinus angustifolius]|uniref:uncharacterized protein LOC109350539 n=1 Tax=Lupinus angustifolius TaxID=3871 RepID=UPI00092E8F7A|nr:PREDICTED: uncharacterized protein LOC109350539 [Lupinus angustifolius]
MAQATGNFVTNLPVLDGKNWSRWSIHMKAILGYQEVADIVEERLPVLEEGATKAQRNAHKQNKKRDCKAISLQIQTSTKRGNFNVKNFNKNSSRTWDSKGGPRKGVDLQDQFSRRSDGKQSKNWKRKTDKRRIKCYNCDKLGHFASEYYASNKKQHQVKQDPEANLAKKESEDFDDEAVQLMMTTISKLRNDVWYLDSGCSNHMTGHKDWLVNFDPTRRNKVKFADNRVVAAEGTGDIPLRMQDV